MESWFFYAIIAAILIACRDIFTKNLLKKYSSTEHLLHYYFFTGVFILSFAFYQNYFNNEKVRLIKNNDIFIYIILAFVSAIIISPCQTLSLKNCTSPEKSKAVVNMNSIFIFIFGLFIYKNAKIDIKNIIGIVLTIVGIYLIT